MAVLAPVKRYFERPAQAFRIKYYPSFWFGNILQFFAFNGNLTANQWLITDLTPSRTLLSLVSFVQGGMVAISSPFSGVVVDRLPKRNLLIVGRLIFAALVGIVATLVLLDRIEIWHLLLVGMFIGLTQSVMNPATQTYVFDIVGRGKIQQAIALNSLGTGISRIAGPGIAGALIAVAGVTAVFYSATVGLLLACVVLVFIPMRGNPHPSAATASASGQFKDGLKYIWSNRPLFWTFACCLLSFFNAAIAVMRPVFARHVLDVGSAGFGIMAAASGVGAIAGAIVVSTLPQAKRPGLWVWGSMFTYGACLFLYSFAFSYEYILVVEFIFGVAGQFWQVSVFSGVQMSVPEEMRGRMVSFIFMFAQMGFVGTLLCGVLADHIGDQMALGLFGLGPMVVLGLILLFKFKHLAALRPLELDVPEREAVPEPTASR